MREQLALSRMVVDYIRTESPEKIPQNTLKQHHYTEAIIAASGGGHFGLV